MSVSGDGGHNRPMLWCHLLDFPSGAQYLLRHHCLDLQPLWLHLVPDRANPWISASRVWVEKGDNGSCTLTLLCHCYECICHQSLDAFYYIFIVCRYVIDEGEPNY